jgi:hypothetical protein
MYPPGSEASQQKFSHRRLVLRNDVSANGHTLVLERKLSHPPTPRRFC